jgi:serine phosphatase RsbU (regulator of sigma subunit)/anti-anti-sigma regulatory factor
MNRTEGPVAALVVDDDPVTRRLMMRALQQAGCDPILEASDGAGAQRIISENPAIGVVLTDILMPGISGLELLRWGREHAPDSAWILLSGLDTFDTAVEAIRLGAYDFLAKPPRLEEVKVSIRNAIEKRALLLDRERLNAELATKNEELISKIQELEAKSELLRRDLERAEVIQRALLPNQPPAIEKFCVQALYRPGQHVGGDLYDVVRLDDRHIAIYVADATGHGVTAAMLSVLFKQRLVMVDAVSGKPLRPAEVLGVVNRSLREAVSAPGLFLTAVYCLLDTSTGIMTVASAGHPPAMHKQADGQTRLIQRTGPALGLSADADFSEERLHLQPNDRLLLYTDGLLQSEDAGDQERLRQLLTIHAPSSEGALAKLFAESKATAGGNGHGDPDDVTVVLLNVDSGASRFDNGAPASNGKSNGASAPVKRPPSVLARGETSEAAYIAISGRGTWQQADMLNQLAGQTLSVGRSVILDFNECEYLDSTALGTIHELVTRGGVHLCGVQPGVRSLFEELRMERVLDAIDDAPADRPALEPVTTGAPNVQSNRRRMLQAHEALSALGEGNREKFENVVAALRKELETA